MKHTVIILGVLAIATGVTSAPASAQETVAASPAVAWNSAALRRPADWYATAEARRLAAIVIQHQSAEGGWPKNTDLFAPPRPDADPALTNTIDNGGTTQPLAFLARTIAAGDAESRAAFDRGLDYLLAAQQPNGGWAQFYPLRGGYHDHITYNDDAMVHVMALLRDVGDGAAPYGFVDEARRERARQAVARGVETLLKTQVRRDGVLTGWCAQHDARTLAPAWARRFEPPSLSGQESVGIVRFLMSLPDPGPDVVAAVDGAVAWLESAALADTTEVFVTDAQGRRDRILAPKPGARIWARFYDLEDGRPIYIGRDSIIRRDLMQIEHERRNGYRYVGEWPEELLDKDYPAWKAKLRHHA
ncbi:pectate lyase [uncultured Brevundimonas sp.]|uniref:pectate lyase n=1 Tax=uncultured Brevundimonas sp. TaxID=213418 RepID=UPI0025ED0177|nr:pectate lyase [uncultured Brevundimonas sp.]